MSPDSEPLVQQPDEPEAMHAHPCCRHCRHAQATPSVIREGHPLACLRCQQYEAWVTTFGRELADMLERGDSDVLLREAEGY